MSYTDEFHKEAYFSDLYELSIDEAAEKIHAGLWDTDQATVKNIKDALLADIKKGNLELVRGSVCVIGKYNSNPPTLNAHKLDVWAEKNGLELESNGEWSSYIMDEAELAIILEDKLAKLRVLQRSGKTTSELIDSDERNREAQETDYVKLKIENEKLKNDLEQLTKPIHIRTETSYLTIIGALLEFIGGDTPTIEAHSNFTTETKLIEILIKQYDGYPGMSQSNLSHKFPKAHAALSQK